MSPTDIESLHATLMDLRPHVAEINRLMGQRLTKAEPSLRQAFGDFIVDDGALLFARLAAASAHLDDLDEFNTVLRAMAAQRAARGCKPTQFSEIVGYFMQAVETVMGNQLRPHERKVLADFASMAAAAMQDGAQ